MKKAYTFISFVFIYSSSETLTAKISGKLSNHLKLHFLICKTVPTVPALRVGLMGRSEEITHTKRLVNPWQSSG